MAKDNRKSSKANDKRPRAGVAVQAFIDPEIRAAVDEFIEEFNEQNEHKATLTSTLEASLKMYLSAKGHWPRKAKATNQE